MLGVGFTIPEIAVRKTGTGGDPTPGGSGDVLLLANGTDSLLLADGASFLKLASSS